MSLRSDVGNFISNLRNQIESALSTGLSGLGGMAQSAGTALSNVWGGGFAGMKDPEEFCSAVAAYSAKVHEAVDAYNASADLDSSFKGQVQAELNTFVTETKNLLNAWVKLVDKWAEESRAAYQAWQDGDAQSVSANVQNAVDDVKQMAQNITLD